MLSRVADSLYWMSRYMERAEHSARLVAVKLEAIVEESRDSAEASWQRVVTALSGEAFVPGSADPVAITQALLFDRTNASSLLTSLRLARDNARQVREQLSTEVWENLNRLYLRLQSERFEATARDDLAQLPREILERLYTLNGVSYSTLRHGEGWQFLELGRYIERAQLVSRLLDVHFGTPLPGYAPPPPPQYLDWLVLLKFCTAFEPYCKEHTAAIKPERIAQFLLFDAEFPHSVRFSVDRVSEALVHVAPGAPPSRRAACERLAGRLKAAVVYGRIEELSGGIIDDFLADITVQCERIHDAVYAAYVAYDAGAVM